MAAAGAATLAPLTWGVNIPYVAKGAPSSERNFVVVMCDTLRYDHIGFNGNQTVQTPNIDAFAAQAVVFDKAYSGGFPTLLNRTELLTGRYTFTYCDWEDMHEEELVLAEPLNAGGYSTGVVFDTAHLKEEGNTLDREFQSWQWIRGQEADRFRVVPLSVTLPADPTKLRFGTKVVGQYLRNTSDRTNEADYFCARTIQTAMDWIGEVHTENKFSLHIDVFDPHEPWDPPQSYVDLYDPGYSGDEVIYPAYAPSGFLTPAELNHMRALYAAEVTLVDRWLGELFAEIGRLGLWDNTVVVLLTDHGILLGEHGLVGKAWDDQGIYQCYPLYEELIHIPFMVRAPGIAPRRAADLVQPADLMPTILDWAGIEPPSSVQGVSLVPTIEDAAGNAHSPAHEWLVSGRSLLGSLSAKPSCTVTDGRWSLIHGGGHTLSALYDLDNDPLQQTDLLGQECAVALDLHGKLIAFLEAHDVAEQTIAPWRVPPCS
jgi:arylsulfatase A-like enzyme